MPRKKKEQPIETPLEAPIKPIEAPVANEESTAKQEFRAFIEKVKEQHPNKFPQIEAELLAKLNQL